MNKNKVFTIWAEGYACTGQSSPAFLLGIVEAETFEQACVELANTTPEIRKYFDQKRNTFWGCRLFDNESDARNSFG